jgi:zinc transporter ZupT
MTYLILILSVVTGVVIARFFTADKKLIQLFLSFSGAYLLSITVLHLLPEVFEQKQENIGLYILLGIVLQTILEFFSRGAEHGHMHAHDFDKEVPWLLFLSLSIHSLLEGMPLGMEGHDELLWAIVIHKIPVSLILFVLLLHSKLSRPVIYLFIGFFALMSPLGSFLANNYAVIHRYHIEITAVIIGVFLHISTAILFESSENHRFSLKKFIAILIGFLIAFIGTRL